MSTLGCYYYAPYFNATSGHLGFDNETVCTYSGGSVTFSSSIRIISIPWAGGSLTGTIYWGNSSGDARWPVATVTSGTVRINTRHEPIDDTGNRLIYLTFIEQQATHYTIRFYKKFNQTDYEDVETTTDEDDEVFEALSANTFRIAGYRMKYWENSAATKQYYPGTTYVATANMNLYGIWEEITAFYWYGSANLDNTYIVAGKTRTMTAAMWGSFCTQIEALGTSLGLSLSITRVTDGADMKAKQYGRSTADTGSALYALNRIKAKINTAASRAVTIPWISTGDRVTAAQFNGENSIKTCFNLLLAAAKSA